MQKESCFVKLGKTWLQETEHCQQGKMTFLTFVCRSNCSSDPFDKSVIKFWIQQELQATILQRDFFVHLDFTFLNLMY